MSVNTFHHELIVLIFRYLKENGFHSAAEELLRHSPQEFVVGVTGISSSLVEIYSSWLKQSKNKCSRSNGGGSIQIKAASKKDKSAKKTQTQKLLITKEEKNDGNLSQTITPAKLKKQQNAVAAGESDSDSDSSLDVDKWKKMLVQMTEVDVAKMDSIDALDSATPKPVKKNPRKSQAKPKADVPFKKPTAKKSGILAKAVAKKQAKSSTPKKTTRRTGSAPETALATLNGTQHLTSTDEERTSASKETKKKEKKKVRTPIVEKAKALKLQHKKKKKDSSESEVGETTRENASEAEDMKPECMGKPEEDIANCSSQSQDERIAPVNTTGSAEEVKRKEKKAKKREKGAADISETHGKDKKSKKRDRNKERISEIVDSVKGDKHVSQQGNPDQMEEARENAETALCTDTPIADVKEKKAKEKKRESLHVEGTPQLVNPGTKRKRKKDNANPDDQQIVEDENTSVDVEEITEPNTEVKKNKKRKLCSIEPVTLFALGTPSPPSQTKKKKSKVDSGEFSATPTTASTAM
ncbi:claspin [Hippocampus zosterae]|uniref:claspin n=1 Tax=Hippocampus zosterae TaxID=109293 RepID=UPI00223C8D85|nr:claspin [Hippocampus zosterae]